MNPNYKEIATWLALCDAERAERSYNWLLDYLNSRNTSIDRLIAEDLTANKVFHVDILTKCSSACKAIETFVFYFRKAVAHRISLDDMLLTYNRSAMFSILLQEYEVTGGLSPTLQLLQAATIDAVEEFLNLAENQVTELCMFLLRIKRYFGQLAIKSSRIALIDLPIGNSLIALLIEDLFAEIGNVEILRISLSRNDSKRQGITRRQLLEERLTAFGGKPNDIFLYVDEWNTGSNFNTICEQMMKSIPAGAFFFQAAVMAHEGPDHPRYQSFCDDHDKMLRENWGVIGADFRHYLPPLKTPWNAEGYFFWSEKDRMAGFRKMQVHGSIFSSLDSAIDKLEHDKDILDITLPMFLAAVSQQHDVPGSPEHILPMLVEKFHCGYKDYCECREELKAYNEPPPSDADEDHEFRFREVMSAYAKCVGNRPAKLALLIAGAYLERLGPLDPADRYFFKTHAAIVVPLAGSARIVHDAAVGFLRRRLTELRSGSVV